MVEGFRFAPFNNFAKLEAQVGDDTAAVLLEVVREKGG